VTDTDKSNIVSSQVVVRIVLPSDGCTFEVLYYASCQ